MYIEYPHQGHWENWTKWTTSFENDKWLWIFVCWILLYWLALLKSSCLISLVVQKEEEGRESVSSAIKEYRSFHGQFACWVVVYKEVLGEDSRMKISDFPLFQTDLPPLLVSCLNNKSPNVWQVKNLRFFFSCVFSNNLDFLDAGFGWGSPYLFRLICQVHYGDFTCWIYAWQTLQIQTHSSCVQKFKTIVLLLCATTMHFLMPSLKSK